MGLLQEATYFGKDQNQWGTFNVGTVPSPGIELSRLYAGQQGGVATGENKQRFGDAIISAGKDIFSKQNAPGIMQGITRAIDPDYGVADNIGVEIGGNLIKGIAGKVAGKMGISSNPIAGAAVDLGVAGLGKILGKDTNYSDIGSQIADKAAGVASMFGPLGMAAGAAVKLANMLGSQTVEGVGHNGIDQAQLGSSYNLSQYDRDDKTFGLFGLGAANRYKKEVNKMRGILDRAGDVADDSYDAKLRQQYGAETMANRARMQDMGGARIQHVKEGGVIINRGFINNCRKLQQGGAIPMPQNYKPNIPSQANMETMEGFNQYLSDTGRMSDDYDYESFYNDKETFLQWLAEEIKNPGKAHFTDKYKRPNHPTFPEESVYSGQDDVVGGKWSNRQGKFTYTPSMYNINQNGGVDKYIEKFNRYEPDTRLDLTEYYNSANKSNMSDLGSLKLKNGGTVNVIPDGKLHKELNHLDEKKECLGDITKKGIPIVSIKDGEIVQHAEIEKEELVMRLELSNKIDELMKSDDDDAAYNAGLLFYHELFNNTEDYTGLIKRTK